MSRKRSRFRVISRWNQASVSGSFHVGQDCKLYGTAGLSETLAADLAISFQRQDDGWGKNVLLGEDIGFEEFTSVRTKLPWTPSERTKVTLTASYNDRKDDIGTNRQCAPYAQFGCVGNTVNVGGFLDSNSNVPNINMDSETLAGTIKIEHEFGGVTFRSISAYKYNDSQEIFDQDFTPVKVIDVDMNQELNTFSQEFQLLSNDDSKPYSWIVGLFYWDNEASYDPLGLNGLGIGPLQNINIFSDIETQSYAAFGEFTYEFTEKTSLTLGLRYTVDDRTISGHTDFGPLGAPPVLIRQYEQSNSSDDPTWRVALNHDWTDNVMVYLTYNRGFKSGVYTGVVTSGVVQDPVDPETIDAYETGIKGEFLEGRLRLNIAAFFYDYDNIQLQRVDAGRAILLNAAKAEVYGFEIDGQAILSDNLSVRFGLSLMDSEYTEFPDCVINTPSPAALGPLGPGNINGPGDCSGNKLIKAPDATYNIGFNYSVPTDSGTWGASATLVSCIKLTVDMRAFDAHAPLLSKSPQHFLSIRTVFYLRYVFR